MLLYVDYNPREIVATQFTTYKTIAIAGNMSTRWRRGGRQQRHNTCEDDDDSSITLHHTPSSSTFPSRRSRGGWRNRGHHQQQPKYRFVIKSQLIPSSSNSNSNSNSNSDSCVGEQVVDVDEDNNHASELNTVDGSSSMSEEGDNDDNIVGRLDRLLSHMEQPQLSEDQLKDNDQSQQNELLVVESIYGENFFILDTWKGLRCFQIHINIEVLGETAITAKLNNSDDFLYSFKVQYLPPIVLTCLLPKSYPSHQPPIFTISVQWLESLKISSLCSELDSIWLEQQGQEVIYQWVEWLHGSSLSHLGFDKEIELGPYDMNHVRDERVVSGTASPDIDIPLLQNYNSQRHHENFLKELHECQICYSEYPDLYSDACKRRNH